jgi:hypothetical protein
VLTLLFVPALYAAWHRVQPPGRGLAPLSDSGQAAAR